MRADRHSATGYLKTQVVRDEIGRVIRQDFAQRVGHQTVSSDLVELYEKARPEERVDTLIELKLWDDGEEDDKHKTAKKAARPKAAKRTKARAKVARKRTTKRRATAKR